MGPGGSFGRPAGAGGPGSVRGGQAEGAGSSRSLRRAADGRRVSISQLKSCGEGGRTDPCGREVTLGGTWPERTILGCVSVLLKVKIPGFCTGMGACVEVSMQAKQILPFLSPSSALPHSLHSHTHSPTKQDTIHSHTRHHTHTHSHIRHHMHTQSYKTRTHTGSHTHSGTHARRHTHTQSYKTPYTHIVIQDTTHTVIQDTIHTVIQDNIHTVIQDAIHTVIQDTIHTVIQDTTHTRSHTHSCTHARHYTQTVSRTFMQDTIQKHVVIQDTIQQKLTHTQHSCKMPYTDCLKLTRSCEMLSTYRLTHSLMQDTIHRLSHTHPFLLLKK
ncbi:LIM domain-containing protein A-like [Papio anubis]|uniref:LIM domain-containing protein A-like n=1 Tax=Papio anubis TaxID=9555 RepID=UPI0012ADE598|nr:LIM domain-containing protein A-like [Papio anubis]